MRVAAAVHALELLLKRELLTHPVLISMPKITIDKYRKFSAWNDNVWLAWESLITNSEAANAVPPESLSEGFLWLGRRGCDCPHYLADLLRGAPRG